MKIKFAFRYLMLYSMRYGSNHNISRSNHQPIRSCRHQADNINTPSPQQTFYVSGDVQDLERETNKWHLKGHGLPKSTFIAGVKRFNQVTAS